MITDYFMITEKSNQLQVIMITDYDYPISVIYFLVNASSPKQLDVATSNFADALVRSKGVFAMVYHRLKSSFYFYFVPSAHSILLKKIYKFCLYCNFLNENLLIDRLKLSSSFYFIILFSFCPLDPFTFNIFAVNQFIEKFWS